MEYVLGSLITILAFYLSRKVIFNTIEKNPIPTIHYGQSHIFELIKPFIMVSMSQLKSKTITQTTKHYNKQHVRVVLLDNKAYWILDNVFYEADEIDGSIDKESAKPVDTMSMDTVQLDKMMKIVEMLTDEGWQ